MNDDPLQGSYRCQVSDLPAGSAPPTARDRARQILLRLLSALERRTVRWHARLAGSSTNLLPTHAGTTDRVESTGEVFRPGDRVVILPLERIQATLDDRGYCDGLQFMEGMGDHCGRTFTVMKQVRLIYDEGERRMLRVKRPRYILEGAICHGKHAYDREGCDRSCFFFWSSRWLARAGNEAPAGSRP